MSSHLLNDQFPICANCGKRTGTIRWGDALAVTHGFAQMWCEVCAYTKQLEHARERAAEIPELEAKLSEAERVAAASETKGTE